MMEDDLVTSLTRQVKEEVIENYVLERRLIELQIEHLKEQARETRARAQMTGERLSRLALLMVSAPMQTRLRELLGIGGGCFWTGCLEERAAWKKPDLQVRALTLQGRFRKLVLQSYLRLYQRMGEYRVLHEDVAAECDAVNRNIESFGKNFDLLAILNFLRNLDLQGLEKKKILGENFTAKEMAELDKNLYIRAIPLKKLEMPVPLDLPSPVAVEDKLTRLANDVFRKHGEEVKSILK